MPGFPSPIPSPFGAPGAPPNPALYQPAPPTDQTRTTADILSALARQLFSPDTTGGMIAQYFSGGAPVPPATPQAPQTAANGLLPGEMRVDPNVLYPPGGPPLRGEYRIPPNILNPPGGVPGGQPQPAPRPTGAPPGGPDGPPMLRPAPDGGDGLAATDPAAVLTTAVNAGKLAQDDPDITKSVIADLMSMGGDPEQNKWLALAKAGFSMAASRNPSILGAAGEGALAGLSDYMQSRQQGLAYRYQAAQLQQAAQEHAAQIAYQQQQQALAEKEFNEKVAEYQQMYPYDVAVKKAQAEMYASHGDYFGARATAPAGGGSAGGWRNAVYAQLVAQNVPPMQIAQILSGKANDPVQLARAILAGNTMMQQSADGPTQALAQAQQLIRAAQQGAASEAGGAGAPAVGSTAGGGMPAGAVQAAPNVPDGTPGGGGKYVAKGGFWYPVGQ